MVNEVGSSGMPPSGGIPEARLSNMIEPCMSVVHGGLDHAELAALDLAPGDVLDFSSNVNPFGPPRAVREALANLDPATYPDRTSLALRKLLAARHDIAPDQILVGNGSNEIIHLIARALLKPGDAVLVIEPTFGEYAHASRLAAAVVFVARAGAEIGFEHDPDALAVAIRERRPRLVWLCAPNNPTGTTLDLKQLAALAAACSASGSTLVLDQAYVAFERDADLRADPIEPMELPCVLRLHSLTKAYALAGLRLGYLLGDAATLGRIARFQPAWSVNSAAQVAGAAALGDQEFLQSTLARLCDCSDSLGAELASLGLEVLPPRLPFFLVRTGSGADTRMALLRKGIAVRDCGSFGLPELVRVAPRSKEENGRLVQAWRELCSRRS